MFYELIGVTHRRQVGCAAFGIAAVQYGKPGYCFATQKKNSRTRIRLLQGALVRLSIQDPSQSDAEPALPPATLGLDRRRFARGSSFARTDHDSL